VPEVAVMAVRRAVRRTTALLMALVLIVAAAVALGLGAPEQMPVGPGSVAGTELAPRSPAAPNAAPQDPAPPNAAEPVRLGGLAILTSDDPALAGCAGPAGWLPPVTSADPLTAVQRQTEQIRGLELTEPVEIDLLDDAEMADLVATAFGPRWDDERVDIDRRALVALGAVEPGTDLRELRVDVFAEQVSGYFLGSDNRIGVRTRDPGALTPLERVVLSHEWEHALTYQNLARPQPGTPDAGRAAAAVVEGSAALTMRRYAQAALTATEQMRLLSGLRARAARDELPGYSRYLVAELQFPYVEGARYLCRRWRDGGWAAVDAAYADPPRTTAAVLFPDRRDEPPRQPRQAGDPGAGWSQARTEEFGAAELLWLLAAPGGDVDAAVPDARARTVAWDGGELTVWTDGSRSAVGLVLVDRGTGAPLCQTVHAWYRAAFPRAVQAGDGDGGNGDGGNGDGGDGATFTAEEQQAALACDGDQVRLGIAPDLPTASAIAD
jgi:hypothetical protein